MPKKTEIEFLIIGTGSIAVGQPCEFGYPGSQSCNAKRKGGYSLSPRNLGDFLRDRGTEISHEALRFLWSRFGSLFASEVRRHRSPNPEALLFGFFNEVGIMAQLSRALFEARPPPGFNLPQFAVLYHLIRMRDGQTPLALAPTF